MAFRSGTGAGDVAAAVGTSISGRTEKQTIVYQSIAYVYIYVLLALHPLLEKIYRETLIT